MSTANLNRSEVAERSRAISVAGYRVELDLRSAVDSAVKTFSTVTTIDLTSSVESTWLDFIGAAVDSVDVDGASIPVEYDGSRIGLRGLGGSNVVRVAAHGHYSRSGEGLHRFVDDADDQTYLYTQYEPADARRVFACFEQPDLKAPFTFEVTAPDGWEVLSNQPATQTLSVDGAQRVTFAPTLPISTYITAIAAGPYHRVASSWSRGELTVELGALCRASLAPHLDADNVFDITRQGLDFYAEYFDYPYPFGKYDQIFVPEYNLGAMENPGLVTFTEAYVFRGTATDEQHQRRANTILHEMAHMWFGDLVTMVWWDDLWLKESFADFMGSLVSAEATRFTDAWVAFAIKRKAWAYLQDQLPTTHPIVADIVDLEAAKLNFDGITYAKGASVLKQLVAFVGRDAFFEAARRYFKAHAFGNTTLVDLLDVLAETSGRDVREWARIWLQTTGVSTLSLDGTDLVQTDPRPHRLAVGIYDYNESGDLVRTERVELDITESRTSVDLPPGALTLLNDEDLTYAKVRLDAESLSTVEASLDRVSDPLARGVIWSSLWNSVRDAQLSVFRYLDMVERFAPAETDLAILSSILTDAQYAVLHYVPKSLRPNVSAGWLETTWKAVFEAEPESGRQLAWARALSAAAAVNDARADEVRSILDGTCPGPVGLALDPDLRWALWIALSATGHASVSDFDGELSKDSTSAGRTAYVRAAASIPDAETKAAAWASATTDGSLSNDRLDATIAGFRSGTDPSLIEGYAAEYFSSLGKWWSERSIEIARRLVNGLFPAAEDTSAVDSWIQANAEAPASLRRLVLERRDHLARDLRAQASNAVI
ncbi:MULTISPECIES: aminopeptidase N [Rhodococcus]|uniref:aminopeptidase N n=1 Tax=Rhodococcus TaxID=1827 RepID=UPI0004C41AD0|nr:MULTISPECIES: aminopeptidase N [Rhodococcus]ARE34550.1 aminopeptidase N [Rhodococcus sp. BH4]KZL30154.1 aminopeptidase N [Rhodococcus qingshengii]MBQ9052045.1 aminopeptidase N [Rhodococcus sp. (in: high G+C Gram-positive bacteria)]MCE4165414.1 aminopeptidase N [Rhodococcus sp. Ni2]MCJ0950180.1 aminopeptidase N [Rhodococcus sp. ARC_M8]